MNPDEGFTYGPGPQLSGWRRFIHLHAVDVLEGVRQRAVDVVDDL
jgi:hypothetical protein